jgi:serine/threonine-protein kinase
MATVYLADDLRHERKVALKVLKPELAAVVGAERFLAEIKVTANLQHPHILPLHDSGEADGFLFYVMPYVEGETLRDRIDREKQLPVDEAVALATKIAGALQHAHEHGVIHRDIKPGNILIQGGEPVVADFGIALAVGAAGSSRLTETGLSLGTPYYMSPEQATGDQAVGASTDTYALGSVLYEMLVGDPPYPGSTAQAVLGKIIAGKPVAATEHRPSIPANVDAAMRKALEKLPADRFASAQEFVRALGDPGFQYGELATAGAGAAAASPWNRLTMATTTLAALLAVALASALLVPEPPAPLRAAKRFEIDLGPTRPIPVVAVHTYPILSPDGTQLVYSAVLGDGNLPRLYIRGIDQLDARELAGTEGAYTPFFSPNGQWVGYYDVSDQNLKKVSVRGGQPLTLSGAFPAFGGTWLEDGTIVFGSQTQGEFALGAGGAAGLFRVPDSGGTPERLTTVDPERGEVNHAFPQVLPGGQAVIFTSMGIAGGEEGRIVALSLETGEQRTLVDVGYKARYSPTGHLVFARQGALWAAPFDPDRLEVTGQEVVVLQGIEMSQFAVPFSFSPDGLLVYGPGDVTTGARSIPHSLVWVDRQGPRGAASASRAPVYEPPSLAGRRPFGGRRLRRPGLGPVGL